MTLMGSRTSSKARIKILKTVRTALRGTKIHSAAAQTVKNPVLRVAISPHFPALA
jgi:hypothetical protein